MSREQQRLEQALQELQAELDDLENVDPQLRQRLEHTLAELQAALASASPTGSPRKQPPNVVQRLTEAAEHFEETHPTLAGTIGSVIDALGRMGI
jgi:hypothetical protein